MEILIAIFVVFILLDLVKKSIHRWKKENQRKKYIIYFQKVNLIDSVAPYDCYRSEVKKASIKNTTVRIEGDFLDFILPFVGREGNSCIENNLATVTCGGSIE